jgi:drug/metabolite transporter (DMT)-like permease
VNRSSALRFILLGCIWGASYTFIKISLEGLTPGQLVLARLILGVAVLLAVVGLSRTKLPPLGSAWVHITITAVFGMVAPFFLLAWGERRASAAMAGVLIGATPLITLAIASTLLPSERATLRKTAGPGPRQTPG